MSRPPFPTPGLKIDPKAAAGMSRALTRLAFSGLRMSAAANEVIWRRSMMMALGAMSGPEAARMVLERPAAFAAGAERAARAAAGGATPAKVMEAALRPVSAKARANARRLRK